MSCTTDSCDEDNDEIDHDPVDTVCDNGLWCDGTEYCDSTLDCQDGTAPETDDGLFCTDDSCDEDSDEVVHTPVDVDDGLFCTDDSCDEDNDLILHNPVDVDDGLFCTVDSCDEDNDEIDHDPIDVDDGVSCTTDSCDEDNDEIDHDPVDAVCDDGLWCNGAEYCDPILDCQSGTAPETDDGLFCTVDTCDEENDEIDHEPLDVDDGVSCTNDSCDEDNDLIVNAPDDSVCDNGLWCDGTEYCDPTLDCQAGTTVDCSGESDQCNTGVCDEDSDTCVADPVPDDTPCDDSLFCTENDVCTAGSCSGDTVDPDDGVSCTDDSCDEENDVIVNAVNNTYCDNGLWCDGSEYCDAVLDCQAGTAPDCSGPADQCNLGICDEDSDTCVADPVPDNTSCDDGLGCTVDDICTAGSCLPGPVMDCTSNNIAGVSECFYNPDGIDYTFDHRAEFTSQCVEPGQCTTGDETIDHTCSISACGAECEQNNDCQPYYEADTYYYSGACDSGCECNYDSCEDECTPGSDDVCALDGMTVLECRDDFDDDPCYEYGLKQDCSELQTCYSTPIEPYCKSCVGCGSECIYEMVEYREWYCFEGGCDYTEVEFVDIDEDMVDDRCDDCIDMDYDGACDDVDNCLDHYNPTQVDTDKDGVGNSCDNDRDNDGYDADVDCNDWDPEVNPGSREILKDGIDNDCDPDTADRPQKIKAKDLQLTVKIMNEETAYRDDELMVAVFIKNTGKDVRDVKIRTTVFDEMLGDEKVVAKIKKGHTMRTMFYIPLDGELDPYEYYLRTVLSVDNVKKTDYAQFILR